MAEYIEREAALEVTCHGCTEKKICGGDCYDTYRLRSIPAADVAPVRYAKDIYYKGDGHCEFKCSLCGVEIGVVEGGELDGGYFRYCPGCGAKMDGGDTDG